MIQSLLPHSTLSRDRDSTVRTQTVMSINTNDTVKILEKGKDNKLRRRKFNTNHKYQI